MRNEKERTKGGGAVAEFDWETVYLQNADLVRRFLFSRCRDRILAEDLTSETFLEAYRCRERYDGTCKLSVWLCQIAKHLLYRHWAAEAKRIAASELSEEETRSPSAEDVAVQRETADRMTRKLNALDPDTRRAVLLRTEEGLAFREIGRRLGKSEVWARVSVHRVLKKWKEEEKP